MKKLEEAFFKYKIIENNYYLLVSNKDYSYKQIKIGDIIFVSEYKYNSSINGNFHLFLVIGKYGIYIHGMIITSKTYKEWYPANIIINKDNKNNLKYNSLVKTDNIYIIKKSNIINIIGSVEKNILQKCINLNKLIKNNN